LDHDLDIVGTQVQLTFDEDVPSDSLIADHKILVFEDRLFLAWNPTVATDLYLIVYDLEGNRISDRLIVEKESTVMTNDVHLTTDGSNVFLIYGESGRSRRVVTYDKDGKLLDGPNDISFDFNLDQLGTTLWVDERWNMFSSDESQGNMIVAFFNHDFTPQTPFDELLIGRTNHDRNWSPYGVTLTEEWGLWTMIYKHMYEEQSADLDATLQIGVFNRDFTYEENFYYAPPEFHAADISAWGGCVFVAVAHGETYVDRYLVNPPDGWPEGADPPGCGATPSDSE
jgi:hypothetical protein